MVYEVTLSRPTLLKTADFLAEIWFTFKSKVGYMALHWDDHTMKFGQG